VNHVAFSSDGKYLATASWDGSAKVWDVASGTLVADLSGHSGIVWGVAFSPDNAYLATGSFDATTKVWDFATGRELLSFTKRDVAAGGVAFSPDGRHLAVAGGDGAIRIYVLSVDDLISLAEARLTRWFTPGECRQYLHLEVCPQPP
jgi:WD40 repeat protein